MATPTTTFLEPIERLAARIRVLEESGARSDEKSLKALRREMSREVERVFADLDPWQTCQLARHPERPFTLDYVTQLFSDFTEIHGDRLFADDPAVVAGFGLFDNRPVAVVGHQKGRTTEEKVLRNFGMPRPEGYRKGLRVMEMAARFNRPIVTFIDTPGAYPGIDAEERGQAEAIARNLRVMAELPVPIVVVVIGEGGSGGALAFSVGDRILMLEHAIYSVISPEGCAAILWKDQARARDAAGALRLRAADLSDFGVVDEVVAEPAGGAQMDPSAAVARVGNSLRRQLAALSKRKSGGLLEARYKKFRAIGKYSE